MAYDDFGIRMKIYEGVESNRRLMPLLPVLARMDGRSFHNFTKGMNRPFDKRFTEAMINTTKYLVEETGATIGYTQSDEISLAWYSNDIKSQIFFDSKIMKMTSQLAAITTLIFYREVDKLLPDYVDRLPSFDARVWNTPTLAEAAQVFVWREMDATRNSVNMLASEHFSDKELLGKTSFERHGMLYGKGIKWEDYPTYFKRGTYIQRKKEYKKFTSDEIEKLPEKHEAKLNPNLTVERSIVSIIDMPRITSIQNKISTLFFGEEPEVKLDEPKLPSYSTFLV